MSYLGTWRQSLPHCALVASGRVTTDVRCSELEQLWPVMFEMKFSTANGTSTSLFDISFSCRCRALVANQNIDIFLLLFCTQLTFHFRVYAEDLNKWSFLPLSDTRLRVHALSIAKTCFQ